MNTNLQGLQAAKSLYVQLLVLVNVAASNPTQQNVDAAVTAINQGSLTSPLVLKPNYSLDGESYDWPGYAQMITAQLKALNELIQQESLPWIARGRARA